MYSGAIKFDERSSRRAVINEVNYPVRACNARKTLLVYLAPPLSNVNSVLAWNAQLCDQPDNHSLLYFHLFRVLINVKILFYIFVLYFLCTWNKKLFYRYSIECTALHVLYIPESNEFRHFQYIFKDMQRGHAIILSSRIREPASLLDIVGYYWFSWN